MGAAEFLDDVCEALELVFGEFRVFVSRVEVRADAFDFQAGERVELGENLRELIDDKAAAPHASVHGEVDFQAGAVGGGELVEVGGFGEG